MTANKCVLITGTSSGLGHEIASALLARGWKVYATARKPEMLKDLKEKGAQILQLDVNDKASIAAAVNTVEANGDVIYGLINNAGFGQLGPVEVVSDLHARAQMDTNVFGVVDVTKAFLPMMRNAGEGRIINMSSIAGKVGLPMSGWYSASKFALEALSDAMRFELSYFGIRVIVLEPGPISTNFGNVSYPGMDGIKVGNPYYKMVQRMMSWSKKSLSKKRAVKSKVIVSPVLKALENKNPKTRYRVTSVAKQLYILRRVASDKMIDFMLRKLMGNVNES